MRRIFWMGVGGYFALWGRRKALRTAERYVPRAVSDRVMSSVKDFVSDVANAQQEAKQAMTQRERELRDGMSSSSEATDDRRSIAPRRSSKSDPSRKRS